MAKSTRRDDMYTGAAPKATAADRMRDDLRVRREGPAVVPAPQEPMNTPEIDRDTLMYGDRRRFMSVRGGFSLGAILTGALVATGAMVVLMAIIAGILAATGVISTGANASTQTMVRATVLTGVGIVFAQFLAYLWGGYTAGRMARGAGEWNGFLVPVISLIVAGGIGALVGWLGTNVHLAYSVQTSRLPIDRDLKIHLGIGIVAASLFAMFVGGIAGGVRGARWHRKLETDAMSAEETARAA